MAVERLAGSAPADDAADVLGTGIAAAEAVPTALFAFIRHIDSFTDAVTQAVQLGGDTDTIAAMTGALAGAFDGATAIPAPWRNRLDALLSSDAEISLEVLDSDKRPVNAAADHHEVTNVRQVVVTHRFDRSMTLLFDRTHTLESRILAEQFR